MYDNVVWTRNNVWSFPVPCSSYLSFHWELLLTSVISAPSDFLQRIRDGLGGRLVAWDHNCAGATSSATAAILGPRQPHWGGKSRREPAYAAGGAAKKKDACGDKRILLCLRKDSRLVSGSAFSSITCQNQENTGKSAGLVIY